MKSINYVSRVDYYLAFMSHCLDNHLGLVYSIRFHVLQARAQTLSMELSIENNVVHVCL